MVINDSQEMLKYLESNPGRITVIGEKLLKEELNKRANGEKSQILDLLEEQGKCKIYTNSPEYIRNSAYLILENLKANPGRFGVIGEELLKEELNKREIGEESQILDLLEKQDKCTIFTTSSEYIKNLEYFVLEHLKTNPGRISEIGENLLKTELTKRANGKESKILDLLEEQGKCKIYYDSPEYIRNTEYLVLESLKVNPGEIDVIGEKLLKTELEKRTKGEKSEILDLLEEQGKSIIYKNSPEHIKNNEYLVLENLKANPGRISVIGEKLLKAELDKRANGEESRILNLLEEQGKCKIYHNSLEHIRNSEYLVSKYLDYNYPNIEMNCIGEELLQNELEKGLVEASDDKKHNSQIINTLLKAVDEKIFSFTDMPDVIKNNVDLMKYLINKDISYFNYLNEETFNEIWKDEIIRSKAKDFKLNSNCTEFISNNKELIELSLNNDSQTLNYVGEREFDGYLENYDKVFFLKTDALPHVKKNPNAIKTTISNKPAHFKFIDSEVIQSEFSKVINNEESEIFEQLCSKLKISDKANFYETLKKLYEKNNSLFSNLNVALLRDRYIPIRKYLSIICDDADIQNSIVSKNIPSIELLGKILDTTESFNTDTNNKDLYADIISGMAGNQYKELLIDLKGKELTEEDLEKTAWLFSNNNYFNIKSLDEVRNLDSIINNVCDEIMKNPAADFSKYPMIEKFPISLRMMHAVLQRSGYMMGILEAPKTVDMFLPLFEGIDETVLTDTELAICEELKNINYILDLKFNEESYELLQEIYEGIKSTDKELKTYKPESMQTNILCNLAAKLYNNECYLPSDKDLVDSIPNGDSSISIFNAGTDFSMIIHAVGAYSNSRNIESYKKDWNRPETEAHGFSTSYIGNNMLGTARITSVVYGFNDIEGGGLLAAAPWDIASNTYYSGKVPIKSIDTLNKLSTSDRVKVLSPKAQLENTRHTHNEIILERNIFNSEDGSLTKRQPKYIVYFTDNYSKKKCEKDELWQESVKAAKEFDIPIVIVEREKCAIKESEEIEKLIENSRKSNNIEDTIEALNKIQTNIAGCRDYHPEIQIKYFPDTKTKEILELIKDELQKDIANGDYEKFEEDYKKVIEFEEKEKKKWEITGLTKKTEYEGYDHELFLEELKEIHDSSMSIDIDSSRKEKLDVVDILEEDLDISKIEYIEPIKECIRNNEQKSSEEVTDIMKMYDIESEIRDIKSTGIYDERKAHSIHHIQDVVIFGTILGHELGLAKGDMNLLIEACKYHDSGRTDDNNTEHAEKSQEIANEKLKDKYDKEELGIIRAAIMYHEYIDKDPEESEKYFKSICDEYEVQNEDRKKARFIADILKDADALDRCRFVNRAQLNPNFLRFKESKSLVEVAKKINEGYAKQICEKRGNLENEEIKKEAEKYGYLSTERRIRKASNRTKQRKWIPARAIGKRTISAKSEDKEIISSVLQKAENVLEKDHEEFQEV